MLKLKKHSQYQLVYKNGRPYKDTSLVLYVLKNGMGENRVGITISAKAQPLSVRRNRAKRLIMESYRSIAPTLNKGYDMVFNGKGGTAFLGLHEVKDEMLKLCRRSKITG